MRNDCFCYGVGTSPGFDETVAFGGPIRAGLQVRVRHVDGVIVQLEVEQ